MAEHVLDQIKGQKNYYRDNFRRLLKYLFRCVIAILVLSVLIIYFALNRKEHSYFASSSDGGLIRLGPVPPGTGIEKLDSQQKGQVVEY
jgi:multidrug efflux pump subunit AcrB